MGAKVIGFDTASTITAAILDKAIASGVAYIDLYEKYSTPALCALIHSKGLGIAPIFETGAKRALDDYPAGHADALAFLAAVPTRFGVPALPAVVAPAWTADFDVTPQQQARVLAYGQGWHDAMAGRVRSRVYANGAIDAAAKAAGIVDVTWTAGGSGMRGTRDELAAGAEDEYQEVGDKQHLGLGISIDSDVAVSADLSWIWWPDGDPRQVAPTGTVQPVAPPTPAPAPPPIASVMPDLKAAQAELQARGLYDGTPDGRWGRKTIAAFGEFYAPPH